MFLLGFFPLQAVQAGKADGLVGVDSHIGHCNLKLNVGMLGCLAIAQPTFKKLIAQQFVDASFAAGTFIHLFDDNRAIQAVAAISRWQVARHYY